ncbi:MAG: Gfo/Idh/MocA family oxidoreductase [Planctomycetota bacterium]
MTRIAFVSTAHIHTKSFVEAFTSGATDGSVHAVWDDVPDRGRRYAEQAGCTFVGELDAVLGDPAVDAFVVCAENTRHLPLLERVLPLGKPVFCEKPLATSVDDARAIAKLVEAHGTPLVSGYFLPFAAPMQAAAAALRDGTLGAVTHLTYRNAHHAAYGRWFDGDDVRWFTDPELAGGGALMDMGTHAVHALRTLGGPVESVWAMTANVTGQYPDVDDFGVIQMRFASGVIGRAEAGWCFTGGFRGLEAVGSTAALLETRDGLVVHVPKQDPTPLDTAGHADVPTRMQRLVAIARGELPADQQRADLDASLDAVAIMDAAYRSADTGKWEPVQDVRA